jgi:carbon storage regulator CsrA
MLVLSRRPDEKILLPTVPAVIKVISTQAGLVRIGIEAPAHVPIVREELCRGDRTTRTASEPADAPGSDLRHAVRNRLNNLVLGLTLLRMQLGDCDPNVQTTLAGIEDELQALRRHVVSPSSETDPDLVVRTPA